MSTPKRKPLAWLIPRPDEPGRDLVRRTQLLLTVSLVGANLIGAAIVFALASWVLPYPDVEDPGAARIANLIGVVRLLLGRDADRGPVGTAAPAAKPARG